MYINVNISFYHSQSYTIKIKDIYKDWAYPLYTQKNYETKKKTAELIAVNYLFILKS